jgi:hypothetical protein
MQLTRLHDRPLARSSMHITMRVLLVAARAACSLVTSLRLRHYCICASLSKVWMRRVAAHPVVLLAEFRQQLRYKGIHLRTLAKIK